VGAAGAATLGPPAAAAAAAGAAGGGVGRTEWTAAGRVWDVSSSWMMRLRDRSGRGRAHAAGPSEAGADAGGIDLWGRRTVSYARRPTDAST
jgi:hypothetical protein